MLLDDCTGSRNSSASFMTQDNNEGDAKMLGSVLDCPHRICIDDIARVTSDKKFT